MQLFYSGASQIEGVQSSTFKSLGGYISATPVRSNSVNNLFGANTILDIQNEVSESRCLFLRNTLGIELSNVTLSILNTNSDQLRIEVAIVDGSTKAVERLDTSNQDPVYAIFQNPIIKKAQGISTVTLANTLTETVTVLGVSIPLASGLSIEQCIDTIVAAFSAHATYRAYKYTTTQIMFEYIIPGSNTNAINFTSTGVFTATSTVFSGGENSSIVLPNPFKADQIYALWFKKSIVNRNQKTFKQLYKEFVTNEDIQKKIDNELPLTHQESLFVELEGDKQEIQLIISWTNVTP